MKQSDQVPVILHIPKNAGTYMERMLQLFFTKHWRDKRSRESDIMNVRRVEVWDQTVKMVVFCVMIDDYFLTDPHMQNSFDKSHLMLSMCSIDTFRQYITNGNAKILTILVKPSTTNDLRVSWFSAWDLLKTIKVSPINQMFLRDTFSRQQSLYNYITSDESAHELTHGKIKHETFEQYLTSDQLEDSWLIRGLTNMPIETIITQRWVDLTLDFIYDNNIMVHDVKLVDNILHETYNACFNKSFSNLVNDRKNVNELQQTDKQYSNISARKKIKYTDLPPEIQNIFDQRTKWDQKLYKHLTSTKLS